MSPAPLRPRRHVEVEARDDGTSLHLVRQDEGRGVWLLAWLDEAGRCFEARHYRRTTGGRLFFQMRVLQRFAADGALLGVTVWNWGRYGLVEQLEIDLLRDTTRRSAWRCATDPTTGQATSQLIVNPGKPPLERIAVPMGDEPQPPEEADVSFTAASSSVHAANERYRQAVLAELRRRGSTREAIYQHESLLTGGPPLREPDLDLLRRVAEQTR
jgi:hypothetical protein